MLDVPAIQEARPDNPLHYFRTIGSTMLEAARLAEADAPAGTVVLAEEQTAGVGRLGRHWHSEAGLGIYCSVLLRPPISPDMLPVITLLLGLATADALQKTTTLACDLRWPNDVLIRNRKVAGILAQLVNGCIVAGIGINVNHRKLPSDLRTPATSLLLESGGQQQSRERIIISLLQSIGSFSDTLLSEGRDSILRAFTAASSYAVNRRIQIEESGRKGITAGLDPNGFLLVRLEDGQLARVAAGGIRPVVEASA